MEDLNNIKQITTSESNILTVVNSNENINTPATLQIKTTIGDRATLKLLRQEHNLDLSLPDTVFGRVVFEKADANGHGANSIIVGGSNFLLLGNRKNTVGHLFPEEGVFVIANHKNFGIGTKKPTPNARLDINGIMKLRIQDKEPEKSEAGMIAVVNGTASGWDPAGNNSGKPYPVFFDGDKWREIVLK
jgi:hypothetical protein